MQTDRLSSVVKLTDLCSLSVKQLALDMPAGYIKHVDKHIVSCLRLMFSQRFKSKSRSSNVKLQPQTRSRQATPAVTTVNTAMSLTKVTDGSTIKTLKQQTARQSHKLTTAMQTRRPKRLQRLFEANQQIRQQARQQFGSAAVDV